MTYLDFQNVYDFTQIESAIQSFFVQTGPFVAPPNDTDSTRETWTPGTGNIAFYVPFQAATFQKTRPRVYIAATQFNSIKDFFAIDANGSIREKAWNGTVKLGIATDPIYSKHTQLRAQVLAIVSQAITISADGTAFATGGVNAFLQYHQLSTFNAKNISTSVIKEEGAYSSDLTIELGFSVLPTAWPAGMQTT